MDSFLDFLWVIIVSFAFVAYLMVMFSIIGDLFEDSTVSGWGKALWIFCLIVFPFVTALVYMIARGEDMRERKLAATRDAMQQQDAYIKNAAGNSPASQIAEAKALLDNGTITEAEYATLKVKALS